MKCLEQDLASPSSGLVNVSGSCSCFFVTTEPGRAVTWRWGSGQVLPRPLFESVSHDLCLLLLGAFRDPTFLFHSMTANIICSIVFGTRFSYKDPKFLRLLDLFYQTFTLLSSFSSQVRELVWEAGV